MHSPVNDLTGRLLKKFPALSFIDASSQATEFWNKPSTRLCSRWLLLAKKQFSSPMNPFVSEFLGQSILRRIGIRTVEHIMICSDSEARRLSTDYVVKFAKDGFPFNLKWRPGEVPLGNCLASRIVTDAASLGYVARHVLKIRNGSDPADKFYFGFQAGLTSIQIELIRQAMNFDETPYLRIAAARVFLGSGCTTHLGNILTTRQGELISIDHVHSYFEDGEDLRMVFGFVNRDPKLLEVLGRIASLTEDDIRASVAEIPKHPACGSVVGLADYFCTRLRLWKELYSSQAAAALLHR
jgi:hypothetical protein